eukprot:591677-Pelagomonas_calceolata.AAC.2
MVCFALHMFARIAICWRNDIDNGLPCSGFVCMHRCPLGRMGTAECLFACIAVHWDGLGLLNVCLHASLSTGTDWDC